MQGQTFGLIKPIEDFPFQTKLAQSHFTIDADHPSNGPSDSSYKDIIFARYVLGDSQLRRITILTTSVLFAFGVDTCDLRCSLSGKTFSTGFILPSLL